jgi:hypothetical protein
MVDWRGFGKRVADLRADPYPKRESCVKIREVASAETCSVNRMAAAYQEAAKITLRASAAGSSVEPQTSGPDARCLTNLSPPAK